MHTYWIHANISGARRWHLVYDRRPGLYFIREDFTEDEYDIEEYRKDFPDNEVVEVPNVHEVKNPLGICDDHMKVWGRMDCPLCDALFLYDRLQLAITVIGDALEQLSAIPDTGNPEEDVDLDEKTRGQVCINLEKFLAYAHQGNSGSCTCDKVGEGRCPKHGWENLMNDLRSVKMRD